MPVFFESAWVVIVIVRKWGGVSLGRTAPTETAHRYKMNWRSVLRGKAEAREVKGKRRRKKAERKKAREGERKRVASARSEQEAGVSAQKRRRKRACGARVGV